MAIGCLILGESGSGKSYSMHNFSEDEVKVISVEKPILPFKNKFEVVRTNDVKEIIRELRTTKKKAVVIDDFQYILGLTCMRRSLEKGWDKFSEMQYDYFKVLDALKTLPDDMIVYFMSHTETDENGNTKIKTIGKALDKYITIEGLFMIVLGTKVSDGNYYFTTQTNGKDTIKTPEGMFPSYAIDNDLKYVDEKIRNYYEIGEFLTDEEMKEIDEEAKKVDILKDEPKKGRRRAKKEELTETPVEEKKEETAEETAGETESSNTENKRESRRRKSQELAKEREEVRERNMEKIVNAGLEGDSEEGVPFEEMNAPELEELPTRKSRNKEKVEEESTGETSVETTTRRRGRRRA